MSSSLFLQTQEAAPDMMLIVSLSPPRNLNQMKTITKYNPFL
jgi:hypothetical protein